MPLTTTQQATNSFFIGMITFNKNKFGLPGPAQPRADMAPRSEYTPRRTLARGKNHAPARD
ncbi:hypothetical protein GBS0709_11280 [Edwardsiella tarda]|nr:hypothetical protein GBS0709_11280 [Edwardsiella tarda]